MSVATFRATCRPGCREVFTDSKVLKRHLRQVHGIRLADHATPSLHTPLLPTRPGVSPKQRRVEPGTHFTWKGHPAQVIGQQGPKNVSVLVWAPVPASGNDPFLHMRGSQLMHTDQDMVRTYWIRANIDEVAALI